MPTMISALSAVSLRARIQDCHREDLVLVTRLKSQVTHWRMDRRTNGRRRTGCTDESPALPGSAAYNCHLFTMGGTATTDDNTNDLSPYELARLQRIQRNEARLRSLGLLKPKQAVKRVTPPKRSKRETKEPSVPTRSSKRLRALKDQQPAVDAPLPAGESNDGIDAEEDPPSEVDYNRMPQDPEQLDDEEFQVYVALRAWRLRRKNELEIEPYKICQNRTLCELIRKRRQDANFAKQQGNNSSQDEIEKVKQDLLSVWGLGPTKVSNGGYAWEMLEVLDMDENASILTNPGQSRKAKEKNESPIEMTRLCDPISH